MHHRVCAPILAGLLVVVGPATGPIQDAGSALPAAYQSPQPPPPLRTIQLDTREVTAPDVALSPDERWLVFTMLGHLFRLPVTGGTAEQLTFGPYYDADPVFSPDGTRVAFITDRDGSEGNVFVLDLSRRRITQLTRESWAARPVWTPDGKGVVYLSLLRQIPGGAPVPDHSLPHTVPSLVRRVPIDGGDAESLSDEPQLIGSVFYLSDGRLGWTVREPGSELATTTRFDVGAASTRIVVAEAGNKQRIVRTVSGYLAPVVPHPSADGLYGQRGEDLLFVSLSDQRERRIWGKSRPGIDGWIPRFAVSRDGKSLYLGQLGRLWKIIPDSGIREPIAFTARIRLELHEALPQLNWRGDAMRTPAFPRSILDPRLSPDGRTLVFGAAGYLWRQSLDGGRAERLAEGSAFEREPAFSHDGRLLAYVRGQALVPMWEGHEEVDVLNLQTGQTRTLTSGLSYTGLSWSPDDQKLLFSELSGSYERVAANVVALNVVDRSRQTLSETNSWDPRPHLSPDQRVLYFSDSPRTGRGALYRLRLEGSAKPEPLTRLERQLLRAKLSPDGKWIAFQRDLGVWIASLRETPIVEDDLRELSPDGGETFDFTSDAQAVIYSANGRIWRHPLAGGTRQEIPVSLNLRPAVPAPLLLRRVRLLDFGTGGMSAEQSLLVAEGRIRWISAARESTVPPDTIVLDAAGRFAIPGLFDMHVHGSGGDQVGFIAYGVTSVRDLGGGLTLLGAIADRSEVTGDAVPRQFYSGDFFVGAEPPTRNLHNQIFDEGDARRFVRLWKQRGASFIKVYAPLSWPLHRAVAHEARRQGLTIVGHGVNIEEITKSVMLGYNSLEHSAPIRLYDDVLQMLARAGVRWDPTLSTRGNPLAVLTQPERLQDEKFRVFTPDWQRYRLQSNRHLRGLGNEERGRWAEQLASIRAAHERGVTLLAGTDRLSGVSLHWELEYFVQAGIPPLDVLRIATQGGAAAVGAEEHLGTLEVGKLADIVLLDANPLDDIKNTQTIWRVIKGGWVFDPEKLRPPQSADAEQ